MRAKFYLKPTIRVRYVGETLMDSASVLTKGNAQINEEGNSMWAKKGSIWENDDDK